MPDQGNLPNPWFGLGAVALAAILAVSSYGQPAAFAFGTPLADRFLREPSIPAPPPATTAGKIVVPVRTPPAVDAARSLASAGEAVRMAEACFEKGRAFYHSGDMDAARREFDLAVEKLMDGLDCPEGRAATERRLEKMVDAIHHYDVEGLGAGEDPDQPGFDRAPVDEILEMTFAIDPKLKDKLKDELSATVSQLPLDLNDAVVSYVNYFSSERGRRIMTFGLRRAARYRPMISRVLAAEGLPLELMQLAQAESGFMPRAISRARAAGMWQFMASRGVEYGLLRSAYHDDRLDPEKATRAAARHLRDLYHEFGDWYLAMAAYNCGPMCVARAVERTGYADFWELRKRNALPKETANYVPAILAMIIVAKNAKDYGLDNLEEDPPLVYDTVEMGAPTNLALVADAAGRPLPEIRELNPALLKAVAPAGYRMRVPKESSARVVAGLNAVPAAKRLSWRLHRVSNGDTVAAIARRYAVPPAALAAANPADLLAGPEAGTVLAIPVVYREARTAARKRTAKGRHVARKARSKAARTVLARGGARRTVSASRHRAAGKSTTRRVKRSAPAAASQVAATRRARRVSAN